MRTTTLVLWAVRDALRRPWDLVAVLFALIVITLGLTVPLLLAQALTTTLDGLLERGPALVLRRLDAGGWAPLPAAEALDAARRVPGVTALRARTWGLVAGQSQALTVLGVDAAAAQELHRLGVDAPGIAEVVCGAGVAGAQVGESLQLGDRVFALRARLPTATSLALHDVVLMHESDARSLLGLQEGQASDLALQVFHDSEADAMVAELQAAMPWPTRVTTRTQAGKALASELGRFSGLALLAVGSALIGLLLLIGAVIARSRSSRRELALLKALGWTAGDIVRWRLAQAVTLGGPAVAIGGVVAYAVVFWPGVTWPSSWLLGWSGSALPLTLHPAGAWLVGLEVAVLIGCVGVLGVLWGALRGAATDAGELPESGVLG